MAFLVRFGIAGGTTEVQKNIIGERPARVAQVSADGVHQARMRPWARRAGVARSVLGWRCPALWLPLGIALALGAVLAWSPAMAARATRENGVVENLQVLLLLGAAAFALRRRAARPRAPDAALALLFLVMVVREIDLHRWVFGRPLRLVADLVVPAPLPIARLVLLALTFGLIAAVAAYCARRLRECAAEGRRVLFEPWGQLLLVATAVLGLTEVFERPLGRLSCCPRDFVEEGLELISSLWLLLAMRARALMLQLRALRLPRRAGDGPMTTASTPFESTATRHRPRQPPSPG